MKIEKILVNNFRSIEKAEITPNGFNVYVGQNNHGKTNFFEAIEWFYLGKGALGDIKRRGSGIDPVVVDIVFSEASSGLDSMRSDTAKTKLAPFVDSSGKIRVRRSSDGDDVKKFEIYDPNINDWSEKLPTGIDNSLLDLLPKFEYVKTKTSLKEIAKYGKTTPIGEMLSGVLSVILEENPKYKEFKEKFEQLFGSDDSAVKMELDTLSGKVKVYLEKQFPDCTEVEFEVKEPAFDDLLKNFETKVDDGVKTDASEKGDGMQRAIMLAIIQTYADFRKEKEAGIKPFIFLIDEGELHLHPTAQRKLKNSLLDLVVRGDQVFLNTHSSVLVADDHAVQSIYTVEKIDGITHVEISAEENKTEIIYEMLGGSPGDLLLPRNFLIVEGESEFNFISRIMKRFYGYKGIQVVKAFGDISQTRRSINAFEKIFAPLEQSLYKKTVVILIDQPSDTAISQGSLDKFKIDFPTIKEADNLFILPVSSLEEYYPTMKSDQIVTDGKTITKWKRGTVEASAMTGASKIKLAKDVGNKITQEQFELEMPIVFQALKSCEEKAFD